MYRYFERNSVAEDYQKYRVIYSSHVADKITDYLAKELPGPYDSAIDVGCGSGQLTRHLASKFSKVLGVDVSPAQIKAAGEADIRGNVSFRVAPAEDLPIPDNSVELVTSATASHYFDWTIFRKEVDRVLKPNGCLAIVWFDAYLIDHPDADIKKQLDNCIREYADWKNDPSLTVSTPVSYGHVDTGYTDLPWPYSPQDFMTVDVRQETTIADFIKCYKTYAVFVRLMEDHPDTFKLNFDNLESRLLDILGGSTAEETKVQAVAPVFIRIARKPSTA